MVIMMKKCRICGREVPSLAEHVRECLGVDYATPSYEKDGSVMERVFYHAPSPVKRDLLLQEDGDTFIVFTGDWHVGSSGTDYPRLLTDLNLLKQVDCKIVLMGDLVDNYIPGSHRGGSHEAILPLGEQKDLVVEALEPLIVKVVAILQGNHEEWSYTEDGFDFSNYLSKLLDTCYLGFSGVIRCVIGNHEYSIGVAHRYPGGYKNPMAPLKEFYQDAGPFDVVVTAHVHRPFQARCILQGRVVDMLTCGSYKKIDRHVSRLRLQPVIPTMPAVLLSGGKRRGVKAYFDFKDALPDLERLSLVPGCLVDLVENEVDDVASNEGSVDPPPLDPGTDEKGSGGEG